MKTKFKLYFSFLLIISVSYSFGQQAANPIIYADVPDLSMIRVGNTYYMSSTTTHMNPGVPIMKSKDLVNWKMVGYAYDKLDNNDALNLDNGKSAYGSGSWASSLRYHKGIFYVTTFSGSTGKTYIYSTKNIETGPWKAVSFKPMLHDHSLFFDDDGKIYMVYGSGKIMIAELSADLSGIKTGTTPQVLIENADAPAGPDRGLPAEGSQLFKINGKYYLFNIDWPRGGMRTVLIHRADKITGPYEGRLALQDKGVAQGGLISTPKGDWFAYLFRDFGAVGRVPYMVPVQWENGWPILGTDGKVPETLSLPASKGIIGSLVSSDDFSRRRGDAALPLAWQWNHNQVDSLWSLQKRPGFLRLTTGRVDTSLFFVKNILTQRTFGPQSSASTSMDVSNMKDGDMAGMVLFQKQYGWVGVKAEAGKKSIIMVSAAKGGASILQTLPLTQKTVYLRVDCDFKDQADKGYFSYSLDGKNWVNIGAPLQMVYTLPHFIGYRFGLFNYASETAGGFADFDYFHISDEFKTPSFQK